MTTQASVQAMHERNEMELKNAKALFAMATKELTARDYKMLTAVALHRDALRQVIQLIISQ